MTSVPANPLVALAAAIAAIVVFACLVYGIGELRLAVRVLRTEPDSVFETPEGGPVELRGAARPAGGLLRSPFTETACLAYEYEVEEERNSKNGRTWTTIASGTRYAPFRLEDDTGSVLVEPPGADFRLTTESRIDVDGGTTPPAPIRRFIDETEDVDSQEGSIDLRLFELRTGKDRRFRERRLDVGEEVHVLGTARYDTTIASGAGQVNAAVGIDERALSDSRWVRVRHSFFGHPFVISDRSERGLGVRAAAYGVGSLLCAVAAVALVALWIA